MKQPCSIPCCNVQIASGLLMCPAHWLAVPKTLRTNVNRSWRFFNRSMDGTREEIGAAIDQYRDACQAAIKSVYESELPLCD